MLFPMRMAVFGVGFILSLISFVDASAQGPFFPNYLPLRFKPLPHPDWVTCVSFSPNNKQVMSWCYDGNMRVWDLTSGKGNTINCHKDHICSGALFGGARLFFTGCADGSAKLWELETGSEVAKYVGHTSEVGCIALSRDRKWLVTGGGDGARLWDLATAQQKRAFGESEYYCCSVVFSGDSKSLFTGGDRIRAWDLITGNELYAFTKGKGNTYALAVSDDDKWLFTGGGDNLAHMWEVSSKNKVRAFVGHTGIITCLALSSDGKRLVTGSYDKTARLWSVDTGKEICRFVGHVDAVRSIAFSQNNRLLATGSVDGTVRIWDIASSILLNTSQPNKTTIEEEIPVLPPDRK